MRHARVHPRPGADESTPSSFDGSRSVRYAPSSGCLGTIGAGGSTGCADATAGGAAAALRIHVGSSQSESLSLIGAKACQRRIRHP